MRFLAHFIAALFMRATTTQPSQAVVDIETARRAQSQSSKLRNSEISATRRATYNPKQYRSR